MILPIHLLDSSDSLEFGTDLVRLSRLGRLGFPLAEGVAVSLPLAEVEAFLEKNGTTNLVGFETKRQTIKQFLSSLKPHDRSLFIPQQKELEKAWPVIIERWVNEIHSHFLRFNCLDQKNFHLKAQAVFFSQSVKVSGIARWDVTRKQIAIDVTSGELNSQLIEQIDLLVLLAKRKLGVDFEYNFLVDKTGLKLTGLKEVRHHLEIPQKQSAQSFKQPKKVKIPRTLRWWSTFAYNFVLDPDCDGYYLDSDEFLSHDQKLFMLVESLLAKKSQICFYKLSHRFIKSDLAAVKFCRGKNLDNVELVFDGNYDRESLLGLKRECAAAGITRKGSMKFWLQLYLPALILDFNQMLELGFDGLIIDVDSLVNQLLGTHSVQLDEKKWIATLVTFLEPVVKKLKQQQIPVVLHSQNLRNSLVELAVKWHITGVIGGSSTAAVDQLIGMHEQALVYGLGQS